MSAFSEKYYPMHKREGLLRRNLNSSVFEKIRLKLTGRAFPYFERYLKLHITPVHYYSPIPDTRSLPFENYAKVYPNIGLKINDQAQLEFLGDIVKYLEEFHPLPNSGLSVFDALVLYGVIRKTKPKKIVEIGAGDTTYISLAALEKNRNEGHDSILTSIEPYPRGDILHIKNSAFELIKKPVQEVPIEFFETADLLFIDSSHVSKIGSDVNFEILEILPRTKKQCWIHFHDIPFPKNYWKDWIQTGNMFWNEGYMLHAFLMFNESFVPRWASHYMQVNYGDKIKSCYSEFQPEEHRLSSFWLERIKD